MRYTRRQRGITFLGFVFVLVVLGIFGYIGLKLFPVYSESFRIDTALANVMQDGVADASKRDITKALVRRFTVNDIRRISERNFDEYVTIEKDRDDVSIYISYRAEVPLFANLSIVVDFEKEATN